MAKLSYSTIASLDGYIEDEGGDFDWAAPDAEVHDFANELERPVGTHLYGRRMYETMAYWEGDEATEGQPPEMQEYAQIWRAADKVVFSRTLEAPRTERTRIERDFDPEAIRRLKGEAEREITIGGPALAAEALRAGLVDECHLFLVPVVIGGGKPAFPGGLRVDLELLDERRFANGTVYLRYAVRAGQVRG